MAAYQQFSALCIMLLFVFYNGTKARRHGMEWCSYWELIGKLNEHPECANHLSTTEAPIVRLFPKTCSIKAVLVECLSDSLLCPVSGQVCIQSNGEKCCQREAKGIPVSEINAKSGNCPPPLGITALQDTTIGCWLDSGCPGIQKCCVEPNPITNSATRICRIPIGITSIIGTPACPEDVYTSFNCLYGDADACKWRFRLLRT